MKNQFTIRSCGIFGIVLLITPACWPASAAVAQTEYALHLDGSNDYAQVADADVLNFGTSDFTVELWVKYDSLSGQQQLVEKWNAGPCGWTLTKLSNNVLRLAVRDERNGIINVAPPTFAPQEWHHVAITRTGTLFRMFWDGYSIGSGSIVSNLDCPQESFKIGRTGDSRGYFLAGTVDEVRIWSEARPEEEIRQMMYRRLTGSEPALVGYWNFNEPDIADQVIRDVSTAGNNGFLGSTPAVDANDPIREISTVPDHIDCNENGIDDDIDIADGTSQDCNGNGVPDECEPDTDCNGNGSADICDLSDGTSQDCDDNDAIMVISTAPDLIDCNENGIDDDIDFAD